MPLDSVFTNEVNKKFDKKDDDYLDLINYYYDEDNNNNNTIVEKPKEKSLLDKFNEYIKKLEQENEELKKIKDDLFNKEMKKLNVELSLNEIRDCRLELAKTNRKLNKLEKLLIEFRDC